MFAIELTTCNRPDSDEPTRGRWPRADHSYREWIGEYAGEVYQGVAAAARSMTEQRFEELVAVFAKASRLEADFWQMGLASAQS